MMLGRLAFWRKSTEKNKRADPVEVARYMLQRRNDQREDFIQGAVDATIKKINDGDFELMNDGRIKVDVYAYLYGIQPPINEIGLRLQGIYPHLLYEQRKCATPIIDVYIRLDSPPEKTEPETRSELKDILAEKENSHVVS